MTTPRTLPDLDNLNVAISRLNRELSAMIAEIVYPENMIKQRDFASTQDAPGLRWEEDDGVLLIGDNACSKAIAVNEITSEILSWIEDVYNDFLREKEEEAYFRKKYDGIEDDREFFRLWWGEVEKGEGHYADLKDLLAKVKEEADTVVKAYNE